MSAPSDAEAFVDERFDDALEDLFALLRQPSISATGEGVAACTALVRETLHAYGFTDAHVVETPGQPSVVAHAPADVSDPGAPPTVLVYGHYDVQPVQPELWTTPPFEPTIREGPDGTERIYARGAGDNKGQWFAHVVAVRALRETTGLPVNVTLLLEGEEESGSPNLERVVREHADELAADLTYVSDGPVDPSGRPHVLLGARGMVYVEVRATGPNRDLHSGNFGGPVPNPAWELVSLLSSMRDPDGRIAIDGFYDGVRPIDDEDRAALDAMPFDADAVAADLGVPGFTLDGADSYLERLLYGPTLNVAGFTSGYGGEGTKTIIPSTATLKSDMRLVADQDPDDVFERFEAHVREHASGLVDLEVEKLGRMDPHRTPLSHPVVEPAMDAARDGFGAEPVLKPTLGGSLPTAVFADELGTPFVSVPYANADEDNHSPDENLALDCFRAGVGTTIHLLERLAADPSWRSDGGDADG